MSDRIFDVIDWALAILTVGLLGWGVLWLSAKFESMGSDKSPRIVNARSPSGGWGILLFRTVGVLAVVVAITWATLLFTGLPDSMLTEHEAPFGELWLIVISMLDVLLLVMGVYANA